MRPGCEKRKVDELENYLPNIEVFGELLPKLHPEDREFLDSVRMKGVLQPIEITPDGTIISGYRRKVAAAQASLDEVPVIVRHDLQDEEDIATAWFESNRYRTMTPEQKARWFVMSEELASKAASQRRQRNLKRGPERQKSDDREKSADPANANGRSDDAAAASVGWSRDTGRKARTVVDAIDAAQEAGDTARVEELRHALNRQSVNAAHQMVRNPEQEPQERVTAAEVEKSFDKVRAKISDVAKMVNRMSQKDPFREAAGERINRIFDKLEELNIELRKWKNETASRVRRSGSAETR